MSDPKVDMVNCGFNKWAIGVDHNRSVVVTFNHIPIDGTITLGDSSIEDLKALGNMFLNRARQLSK